jgi:tyrosine-protein phosphatase non-receptor type 9
MKHTLPHSTSQEYHHISEASTKISCHFRSATLPENLSKNRYMDILPLDETRVVLQNDASEDYINANFIKTENINCICTQAPLPRTFYDFWMMILQQNCNVIVALNRQMENKIIKGERYWPEKDRKLTLGGDLTLKLLSTLHLSHLDITLRKIKISYQSYSREIYHLHYEGWPDFGVPESSLPIRELLRLSHFFQTPSPSSPIVIHCSAGIGRSGAFIAIATIMNSPIFKNLVQKNPSPSPSDLGYLLQVLSSHFSVSNIVLTLRKQRHPGMVQTPQQYKFIYSTLVDEIYQSTVISEAVYKAIQWENGLKNQILKKCRSLSKSGPVWKTSDKAAGECYDGFLTKETSNDLCYLFKKKTGKKEGKKGWKNTTTLGDSWCEDERAFLCKSGPLVMVL